MDPEEIAILKVLLPIMWGGPPAIAAIRRLPFDQVFGAFLAAVLFSPFGYWYAITAVNEKKKAAQERDDAERRQRKEAEKREEEKRERHRAEQESLRKRLSDLFTATTSVIRSLPVSLAAANRALDKAETEFRDGAFSPFWNEVEVAIRHLAAYDNGVRQIAEQTASFAGAAKALETTAPMFIPSDAVVPDSTRAIERMRALVREAHRNPTFATIYEQRRTNGILVAGFANLVERFHISVAI